MRRRHGQRSGARLRATHGAATGPEIGGSPAYVTVDEGEPATLTRGAPRALCGVPPLPLKAARNE